MDFIGRHGELFERLGRDLEHFLGALSGAKNVALVEAQMGHLLADARLVEEKGLVREIEELKADWGRFAEKPTRAGLEKIQQKALRIKQELRGL